MSQNSTSASAEPFRFEPTVATAIRRYRVMVIAVVALITVAAVGYTLKQPKIYRGEASVTVPQQASSQTQQSNPGQYLDSQVLLLQSQAVARQAATIANRALGIHLLSTSDFFGPGSMLEVIPPTTASPGGYGGTIVGVSFAYPNARIAQVGTNAVLRAYSAVLAATIRSEGDRTVAGIDRSINQTARQLASVDRQLAVGSPAQGVLTLRKQRLLAQQGNLLTQRTQTVVNEQTALAQHPTVAWADTPKSSVKKKLALAGGVGLIVGLLLGAGLAFARASRRRDIVDRQDPAALYGVPLIGEIPAFQAELLRRARRSRVNAGLPMAAEPSSPVAEAFRFAAGSVERIRAARGMRLSLVFVSPLAGSGKSTVVANLAIAIAEGGTRVLVVDGDAADGDLTARLLPGARAVAGFEQMLAKRRALADYVQSSPFSGGVTVLGSGPAAAPHVTGAARSRAIAALLIEAKATFDVVLVDSPALLQVADAAELVKASDATVIVVSPNEPIRDHREVAERLGLMGADVAGYVYNRAPRSHLRRYQRYGSSPPGTAPAAAPPPPVLVRTRRPMDGNGRPLSQPTDAEATPAKPQPSGP
jgi:Mrp family chromosome partitioning ATPase/capsular polysaccharide biosynthesis protein